MVCVPGGIVANNYGCSANKHQIVMEHQVLLGTSNNRVCINYTVGVS